jgi:hypothetical protein
MLNYRRCRKFPTPRPFEDMGRLHSYRAVEMQQRAELVLDDSSNVGHNPFERGEGQFLGRVQSVWPGGGAASYVLVFTIYTCPLLWLRLIWDIMYSISCIETLALSPMYDGMMPLQTPPLSFWDRCQPTCTRLSLDNVTPIAINYVRRNVKAKANMEVQRAMKLICSREMHRGQT